MNPELDFVPVVGTEDAIRARLAAEREGLPHAQGSDAVRHYRRPQERPFLAHERNHVTILIGGLTWKHEALIRAVFQGNGYRCETLPVPDVAAFQTGKEFSNNGHCNPVYFTAGSLVQYLNSLAATGMSRQEIVDRYVFFTAGSCGPCRYGMYEASYRHALQKAGYEGFRVILFQPSDGIRAASGEPGLRFTVDFGLGMLNALQLGDVIHDLLYQIRPFEIHAGDTDRVFAEVVRDLCAALRGRRRFDLLEDAPPWVRRLVGARTGLKSTLSVLAKVYGHLYGKDLQDALEACRERIDQIRVDRTRVRPVVKIIGEFWAQITEGDGNFQMFRFLEREGAQVVVEPVSTWVAYMAYLARLRMELRRRAESFSQRPAWHELRERFAAEMRFQKKALALRAGEALWARFYHRICRRLGGLAHPLVPQAELARLAEPFFHPLIRGGEGYMEVGKSIYYTVHRSAHMVLALKPFGCMPSTQSDAVLPAVNGRFRDMVFLSIETSGEGEVNAHSRVQMALCEARAKARAEFETALRSTGKRLADIQEFVAEHAELQRPFYPVPERPAMAGAAAQFVLHVSSLMDRRRKLWRMACAPPAGARS